MRSALLYQNADWLTWCHVDRAMTINEMANEAGCGYTTIRRWMEKLGLSQRGRSEAQKLRYEGDLRADLYRDERWLRQRYWEMKLSAGQMADIAQCSEATIRKWMLKYNVPRRSYSQGYRSPTSIEIAMAQALDDCGISHQPYYSPLGYNREYDEFVHPNILVEIQGDYWHGNPAVYGLGQLSERQRQQKETDTEKAKWAEDNGYVFVAIWGREIREIGADLLVHQKIVPLLKQQGDLI